MNNSKLQGYLLGYISKEAEPKPSFFKNLLSGAGVAARNVSDKLTGVALHKKNPLTDTFYKILGVQGPRALVGNAWPSQGRQIRPLFRVTNEDLKSLKSYKPPVSGKSAVPFNKPYSEKVDQSLEI